MDNVNRQEYTKGQITAAKRYEHDVDILNALLEDDKKYTTDEADNIIKNFKEGRVK
jgi:hypothetical protein